ncbi:PREDICTED: protein CCSMST1 [Charadrius vociferus]|uniref:protein CCSMST1 n=1 Tax=Charadrius vociferus TaxID=50402 RepID=UPI0005211DE0|nr:PREDICTED: protein CCSMST1 [Charadrius vociferus]
MAILYVIWNKMGSSNASCGNITDEGAIPFSTSKANPRVWSVGRSMGSDHERPWVKVLPLSLLCSGLLLWCAFREKTEIDERLEAIFSGQVVDSLDEAPKSAAPSAAPQEK